MRKGLAVFLLLAPAWTFGGDYLFLNRRYIDQTRAVINEAAPVARQALEPGSALQSKYDAAVEGLHQQMDNIARAKALKKLKPGAVAQVKDAEFAAHLNVFKDALSFLAQKSGRPPQELFPSYKPWLETETAVVRMGIEQRLESFQTRFGPESEQINFLELLVGETLFRGDEAAPSPWEPIMRLSVIQLTTAGPGITSTFQAGMNHYFVRGRIPAPLSWIGVSNHVGLAASLQYLENPRLLRFKGRPAFGAVVHLDRKEVGASWDPDEKTVRLSLGYAFQFVPFVL